MLFGQDSSLEAIGAKAVDLIIVESDGDIEAVDTLKVVGRAATSLNLNVWQNEFDDALTKEAVYSRLIGYSALCEECRNCPFLNCCGGGYVPHRFGRGRGFLNPSVYCADIIYLIKHIQSRLSDQLVSTCGQL